MKFTSQIFLRLYGALALLVLGGCDQSSFQPGKNLHEAIFESRKKNDREEYDPTFGNETNYPIYDTALWAEFRNKNLFWINNEAVVFNGFETGKYVHYDSIDPNKPKIIPMVWDVRRQEYYPLLNDNSRELRIICKLKSQFYYSYGSRDSGYNFYFGVFELDNEKYVIKNIKEKIEDEEIRSQSRGFCDRVPEGRPTSKERPTTYLPEIEGEIHHYPYADRAFFTTKEHPAEVTIPTRRSDFYTLFFSEMLGAYQYTSRKSIQQEPVLGMHLPLIDSKGEQNLGNDYFNFILRKNGEVQSIKFPDIPTKNIPKVSKVDWTAAGPIFQASLRRNYDQSRQVRGLYLLTEDNEYVLVLEGVIGNTAISANGCRLAVDQSFNRDKPNIRNRINHTLKIINFCMDQGE